MNNPNEVLLGHTESSHKHVSCENADPATFVAGVAVRRKSDGSLSLSSADGSLIGVSLGRHLSDIKKTAVVRAGYRVPIRLTPIEEADEGEEYVYAVKGAAVRVSNSTGLAVDTGGTLTSAFYISAPIEGIDPITKAKVVVALIDMGASI